MFTAEDLCRKGFYGVPIEEISKNEINQIVGAGKGEIVTGESVAAVKENLDPTLFRAPSGEENGLCIRPTNKEFTEYATKGRLKFNCPEYYFIFHELITNKDPIDCNVVRSKLKVGAKSFFYFIKKLCGAGLVKKEENKIFLTNNPVISNNQIKECSVPKEWLRNVPIYSQIVGLLHREEGVTTQDIKEYLGMSNKKANIALRHVLTGCTEIKTVTEFEGKIRRSRYILNTHYEKQKESFGANPGTDKNKKQSDSINTEIRTKVIEDLVAREKAIVYNQYFHRSISEILGSKHTIDKNTVIRTANASKVINLVQVYIKYPTKTITRNVFKVVGISDTDPAVIRSIQNEGYKRFSIITKNGVVDYHFESKEDSEDREEKEESEEYRKYYRSIMITEYDKIYTAVSNGYILNKQERMDVLLEHWKSKEVPVDKTYETLYGLSLFVFLSIFSFCEINLLERIKAYYSEKDMDWKKLKYEEFRADAPNDLSKYFASKKLLPVLEEYIDELVNDGALEEIETHGDEGVHKEEKYRIVKKTEDNYKDKQHSKDLLLEAKNSSFITEHFLSKEERTVLCEKMCDEYKERIGSGMSHGAMRHTRTGAAVNVIIGTGYSKIVKNELIRMFIKSIRPKKVYVLNKEIVRVETNGENNYDILCNREYTVNGRLFSCDDVLECIRHIKDTLIRDGTVLLSLLEHDYFLCEFVVLSMSALKILSLSKSSIKNNIILNMKVTEEYKRAISHAKSLSKTTAALPSVEKDKTAKKKEKKAQRSYLQTFSIQGIEDIPISDDAAYYSTISLYIYLLHHGSGQLQHISRKNFLTVAEIEDIASRHPSLFTIHYTQPHDHSAITLTVL